MIRFVLLAILFAGCHSEHGPSLSEPTRELAIEGLRVQVPASLVALDEERTQQLRDSYTRQEPGTEVSLSAVRGPTLMDATVSVARGVSHRDLPRGLRTVREALGMAVQDMADVFRQGGAQLKDARTTVRSGGLESCVVAVLPQPQLPPAYLCALIYVAADGRLRTLSTSCMAKSAAICERVMASRTYAATGGLDLAKSIPMAPPTPP